MSLSTLVEPFWTPEHALMGLECQSLIAPRLTLDVRVSGFGRRLVKDLKSLGMRQSQSKCEKCEAITQQYLSSSVQQIIFSLEPRVGMMHLETENYHVQNILALAENDEQIVCLL